MGMHTVLPKAWKIGDRFRVSRGPTDLLGEEDDPHPTKQGDAAECDINNIMRKYEKTGVLPALRADGMYGDFSDMPTFQEACAIVEKAREQFDGLDARTRARFENDPGRFLEFCSDPKNLDEMVELGLAVKRKPADSGALEGDSTPLPASSSSKPAKGSNKGKASAAVEGDDA